MTYQYTQEKVIELCIAAHGDRYDYSKTVYINSFTKIEIGCGSHGYFWQLPTVHYGQRCHCPKCANEKLGKDQAMSLSEIITRAKLIHDDFYDYSSSVYINMNTKMKIGCPLHGFFWQNPSSHIFRGCGCEQCGILKRANSHTNKLEDLIPLWDKVHNYAYDYSRAIYVKMKVKIEILCKRDAHGAFWQTPDHHGHGDGCPKCAKNFGKKEKKWLDKIGIPDNTQHRQVAIKVEGHSKPYRVDGFDPTTNTVYEFYGDYYHGNLNIFDPNEINPTKYITYQEIYDRTMAREQELINMGYKIVSKWENDWDKENK